MYLRGTSAPSNLLYYNNIKMIANLPYIGAKGFLFFGAIQLRKINCRRGITDAKWVVMQKSPFIVQNEIGQRNNIFN